MIDALQNIDSDLPIANITAADWRLGDLFAPPRYRHIPFLRNSIDFCLRVAAGFWFGTITELTSTSHPIQISIFKKSAALSVSYLESEVIGQQAFELAWKDLDIMKQFSSSKVTDPQCGRQIDLDTDFETCFSVYRTVAQQFHQMFGK